MNYIQPNWNAPFKIKAYTTLRSAWAFSDSKSDTAQKQLKTMLQLPSEPTWLNQVHGNQVLTACSEHTGREADASYTNQPNQVCLILTADCLPILLCTKQGSQVAAIHAGWRSLASGIIENTISALAEPGENIIAWLGPAIGPCHFEVGLDVYDAFTKPYPEAKHAFKPSSNDKWLANLYSLAEMRLQNLGVTRIHGADFCTYEQNDLFPSYRRDGAAASRIASVIWISS